MNTSDEKPARPTIEQLRVDLRRLDWANGLSDDTLTAIANTAEWVEFHTGEVILEVDTEITHLYFLITGRVQSTFHDSLGKEGPERHDRSRPCHCLGCPGFIGSLSLAYRGH
jgi:NTE family protein